MRQLLNWRLFAALGALLLLAVGVNTVFAGEDQQGSIAIGGSRVDDSGEIVERTIDLVAPVQRIERSDDFAMGADGTTVGRLDAVLDENRTMRVAPGTPGVITCAVLDEENGCAVLADVLGQAVVWFAVLPRGPRDTVELPPITDLQDGYALFVNGWKVRYETVIDRDCEQDVPSFSEFLRRFGPNSITRVDLETQKVATVVCGPEYVPPTTDEYDGSIDGAIRLDGTTVPVATVDAAIEAPDN